ncbi:MAG: hypothetical protein IJ786_00940 [Bacteroidaceae bacterium]|nr:hypothetical protein [Bacteroidaceae bacterium]
MKHAIFSLLIGLFALSCSAQQKISKKDWKATQVAIYKYTNNTLPKEHIKNYAIEVYPDHVTVVMWNGFNDVNTESYVITEERFQAFIKQLKALELQAYDAPRGEMVKGAPTESLTLYKDKGATTSYFDAYTMKGYGTLHVSKGYVGDVFRAFLPAPIDYMLNSRLPIRRPEPQPKKQTISAGVWEATYYARYRYTDSSTLPQYHRSYSISACADSLVLVISSYSDELLRKVYPFSEEQFRTLITHLSQQDIAKIENNDPEPVGGSTETLSFWKDDEERSYFTASSTSGVGTLIVGHGTASEAFIEALPESLTDLLNSTRE